MNWFEQLLGKIEDAEEREQFSSLASKHSAIKDWIVDPEIRSRTEQVSQWAESEWDYDHQMSKLEYQQQQELAQLKTQLAAKEGNAGMELNELNDFLGKYIKDNGLMTKADHDAAIKQKTDEFAAQLDVMGNLATRVPYLVGKHQKEFGDVFDTDDFVKQATEKGYARYGKEGLDKFYEEFVSEKRETKRKADTEAEIERRAAELADNKVKERLAANGQGSGSDLGAESPEMGHFEKRLRGMGSGVDAAAQRVPDNIELGRGVGKYAATLADARDRASVQ